MDNWTDPSAYPNQLAVRPEAVEAADEIPPPPTTLSKAAADTLHPTILKRERTPGEQQPLGRVALTLIEPAGFLGTTDPIKWHRPSHDITPFVQRLLCQFSQSRAELGCVPQTPEIDTLLADTFAHEYIQPHHRHPITDPNGYPAALAMIHSAIVIHRKALYNSRHAEDASAWYPIVRQLLSASDGRWRIPDMLSPDVVWSDDNDNLQTVDASTKTISASLAPGGDVKIDIILMFNARLEDCVRRALSAGIRLNVFSDSNLAGNLVVLGCKVTTANGPQMDAQYELGVFGMKTLQLTRGLAGARDVGNPTVTDVAVGLDVCGHVWSLHLTYWRSDGALVTHGPVLLGSTDTLVGTLKIVRWMCIFERWSDEVWEGWIVLLKGITDSER